MAKANQPFNDDLLINQDYRTEIAQRFPSIMHLLHFPELQNSFVAFDRPANRAKKAARRSGKVAIVLGCIALFFAAAEPVVEHLGLLEATIAGTDLTTRQMLAVAAGVAGLLSLVIGYVGVLHGPAKRRWLHNRLMTERIRQFHFQSFMVDIPAIMAAAGIPTTSPQPGTSIPIVPGPADVFRAARVQRFEAFLAAYRDTIVRFQECTDFERDAALWLVNPDATLSPAAVANPDLEVMFDAYRELRILHQIGYAKRKLENGKLFSGQPKQQHKVLAVAGAACIAFIFLLHVGVLLGVFLPRGLFAYFLEPAATMLVIWIAVLALAVRTLEQALQPEQEIERYQRYALACDAILKRFDAAAAGEKLLVMQDMERLTFDEMRTFLVDNDRARFVM